MTGTRTTSTGHALSDAPWLDDHFQSARPEYEESLRYVGVQPGWTVLDAGCGNGCFVPLLCDLVGPNGAVVALDLAPENVAQVDALARDGHCPAHVTTKVGSILALPFGDAAFDGVWSANVTQYLTQDELLRAVEEFGRVLKPGGTLAIKEFDSSIMRIEPTGGDFLGRLWQARREKSAASGVLGPWCGTSIPSRLRRAGLTDIARKGWLVERWAPLEPPTRRFVAALLARWSSLAPRHDLPAADLQFWKDVGTDSARLLDDPDFCYREFFVVTVGRVAA
jgi:SAM-dependent methyltransferase